MNNTLTQQLKDDFARASGHKMSADNNPSDFSAFLYEKLLKTISDTLAEELAKQPESKPYFDSFQKNLNHKLGSSFS
ncbi:hypothetical protein D0C36_00850 [Mucilaginibacter conchicola]|uniref:Uncharacterized protein n=1 Tax=Mucilaginibacter conchicola TaxID=2303333 RepID=A0A372NVH5_9SPHI|nr:hypothetical protein [Mucilaginibacter conchicola]RFZ94138.1 hypothetical protein D0C36_00850 [Mucilaginibacter conchicola]